MCRKPAKTGLKKEKEMLLEFRVKNFRSFKDEQTFSMVASSKEKSLPGNVLKQDGYEAVKTAAIYGANASGKSNLIKAIAYFKDVVKQSTRPEPGAKIYRDVFAFESQCTKEETLFEVVFFLSGYRFQYGFSFNSEIIIEEWLYAFPYGKSKRFPFGKPQTWFTRKYDAQKDSYTWNKSNVYLKGIEQIKRNTLPNALFLSRAVQNNVKSLLDVYLWIVDKLRVIPSVSRLRPVTAGMLYSDGDETLKKLIINCLQRADIGIKDVSVKRREIESLDIHFPKDMPDEVKKDFMTDFLYEVTFAHEVDGVMKTVLFPFEQESEGTQRYFQLLGPVLETLARGYTVFIDELESSLHPLLVRRLIQLFNESKLFKGQIVFTTHDTTQLDSKVLRRDQIWFTEKDNAGASSLYPLSDYQPQPRIGEALEKGYLSGRYGAIPILEEFGING